MSIDENLKKIKHSLPAHVTLVAVSKFKPIKDILQAYEAGQRVFGENRVQELIEKAQVLPADIEWHMIGHLQSNKVKYMASFVHLIHGVDNLALLAEIDKQGKKAGRILKCLLQVHIAKEETKFGFTADELFALFDTSVYKSLTHVQVCGIMGIATLTDDNAVIRNEFKGLKNLYNELKNTLFVGKQGFDTLSMGMSGDYKIAIEEGSTMVRIGSSIFGAR